MLISCRREGDAIKIGDDIEIRIISLGKSRVTLGVVAPHAVKIATRKLTEMELTNTMAAAHSIQLERLLGTPKNVAENVMFVLDREFHEKNPLLTEKGSEGPDE